MPLTAKLEAAQARIRDRLYRHFSWVINAETPWTPFDRPLSSASIALISTCGLYCADSQVPFDAWNDLGDPSFRSIHVDTLPERLSIAHSHYDHQHVARDVNVAMPFAHFQRLVGERVIGGLHPWSYSFMGYLPETMQLAGKTAPAVARRLAAEGVHAAFLTPC